MTGRRRLIWRIERSLWLPSSLAQQTVGKFYVVVFVR